MRAIARMILVAALVCGSGCARSDWIDRTLVTVDVTGRWIGDASGGSAMGGASYEFVLEQQGPKVKGSMRRSGQTIQGRQDLRDLSGPIDSPSRPNPISN